ncbi:MAG: gluconate 2-dehydrogenase subunit 3 family protein [Gemmatimonadaceae bacterium]
MTSDITRRDALRRAALLLGGTLSAPTILGVLAGCGDAPKAVDWAPRTLTPEQRDMVVAIADAIIPETDTPGARAARVDEFVDAMLSDHYPAEDRERFLAGLARVETRARGEHGKAFGEITGTQQSAIVAELDRLAFSESPPPDPGPGAPETSPRVREGDVAVGPPGAGANPADAATPAPDATDTGPESFFRMMKELAVVGYYTSEVGSTRELRVNPMVPYRGIPYTPGTPAWA